MTLPNLNMRDLGPAATAADVAVYRAVVEARMADVGCDELTASDWLWGNGDWMERAAEYHDFDESDGFPDPE